jgi:hypothetical protein
MLNTVLLVALALHILLANRPISHSHHYLFHGKDCTVTAMKTVYPRCPQLLDGSLPLEDLERWMHRNEERLKPYEVEVPRTFHREVVSDKYYPGACYPRSIFFIRRSPHLPQALYVLGEARCGGRQQHWWVELKHGGREVVFDAVMQTFYAKAGYYQSEHVWAWYRFDRQATMWISRRQHRQEHWSYRWDNVLDLPFAERDEPPMLVAAKAERIRGRRRLGPAE